MLVILVEIKELCWRTAYPLDPQTNEDKLHNELDFVDEVRYAVALTELAIKQKVAIKYNKRVLQRDFEENDHVLRDNLKTNDKGKSSPNWEGPYRIITKIKKRSLQPRNPFSANLFLKHRMHPS